jgi:hypothetical protein
MPRPQFTIRTLLWLTLVVALACVFGPPLARGYAPRWGVPSYRVIGNASLEVHYPTGRVEIREDNKYGHLRQLLEVYGKKLD